MKLKRFRVTNFRSVIDSGWINCYDITTLVGINESGKSNILLALWKLNPARDGEIDPLHDLPAKKLSTLRDRKAETPFIEAVFSLEDSSEPISEEVGINFPEEAELSLTRLFSGKYHYKFLDENLQNTISALMKPSKNDDGEDEEPKITYESFLNTLIEQVPTFVYYSNYGNLSSKIYLPHAVKWLNNERVEGFEPREDQVRTLRVLFDYVNLTPKEILELGKDAKEVARQRRAGNPTPTEEDIDKAKQDKEQRTLLLNSAGAKLTSDFRDWWKQGEYKFRFQADGEYFLIWVSDDKRPEEVDLEQRSTGLQWFLSFYLVFLVECENDNKDAVLLLDEAGLTLHPLAQKDLSTFFNKLAENNQIINTTHSPFIIDPENIDRCRVVYTDYNGGTIVSEDLRAGAGNVGEKSIYAIHAALGLTVSDVMFQGSQVVVVEGVSDQFYLSAIKNALIREDKFSPKHEIVFAPSGGVKGVSGISAIISSKNDDLPFVILDSDKSGDDFRRKLEDGLYKGNKDLIISIKNITGMEYSEVEDLVPFELIRRFVDRLFNASNLDDEFYYQDDKPLVPQIEAYAEGQGIVLKQGWKVDIARAFKATLSKNMPSNKKKKDVLEKYFEMWKKLFYLLNR